MIPGELLGTIQFWPFEVVSNSHGQYSFLSS